MTESDPDALETLRTVGSEFEAHTLVAVLREEGIEAHDLLGTFFFSRPPWTRNTESL